MLCKNLIQDNGTTPVTWAGKFWTAELFEKMRIFMREHNLPTTMLRAALETRERMEAVSVEEVGLLAAARQEGDDLAAMALRDFYEETGQPEKAAVWQATLAGTPNEKGV